MDNVLQQVYWGNTVQDYLIALGSIVVAWVFLRIIRMFLIARLKKITSQTKNHFDDLLIGAIDRFIVPFLYLLLNYLIITRLDMTPFVRRVLEVAMIFVSTWYAVRLVNFLICGSIQLYMERKQEPKERVSQLNGMLLVIKVIVWVVGIIMLIDNLGYNVTTIIAGLGVGGIAVALAAQNILGDLFSYLVIFFDKPFEVGDYIVIGNDGGTVEKIGIKTSHVRSLDGQQLVMPNAEMVKSVIQNYKRLLRRRMLFKLFIALDTPTSKLRKIPALIRSVIETYECASFDRAHCTGLGTYSVDFEIVYYIDSADFNVFMDTHQGISLDLLEKLEKEDIRIALPTSQTILQQITANPVDRLNVEAAQEGVSNL